MTKLFITFGSMLRDVLDTHDLSQAEAAEMADCDTSHISRLVTGKRMPSRDFIDRLVHASGLPEETAFSLYASAGFIPLGTESLILDPDLMEVAKTLNDASIPHLYRVMLRQQISALADITRQMASR